MRRTFFILAVLVVFGIVIYQRVIIPRRTAGKASEEPVKIGGLILPHHDIAGPLVAESLEKLSDTQNFSRVVIVAPNHFHSQTSVFVTSVTHDLPIDKEFVTFMDDELDEVVSSNEIVEGEHGISVPGAYIRQYFPNAKIIPLLIPSRFNEVEINNLAGFLKENLPSDSLVVASVDFSHETMQLEAKQKNSESIAAIQEADFAEIFNFGDDHMDSPGSIALLIKTMKLLGFSNFEVWRSAHASEILDDPLLQGTSYVIGVFY